MSNFHIRPLNPQDRIWASNLMTEHWGSEIVIVHDTIYQPADLPGFVAIQEDKRVGLITYHIEGEGCEDEIELEMSLGSK